MTVYRNARDTVRVVVHRRDSGEWDTDTWYSPSHVATYSSVAGDAFRAKAEARAWAEAQYGKLTPLPASTHPEVTSHWRNWRKG